MKIHAIRFVFRDQIDAVQLCSVTEVALKSPLVRVCVKRSPIRYSCRAGEKAMWCNVNIVADPDVEIRRGGGAVIQTVR